jgi:hypothetical protein
MQQIVDRRKSSDEASTLWASLQVHLAFEPACAVPFRFIVNSRAPLRTQDKAKRRGWRPALVAVVAAALVSSVFAQSPAPPDVQLTVSTENGRTKFHLGEEIRLTLRYTASVPGKYLMAGSGAKATGWDHERLECTPKADAIDRDSNDGLVSGTKFLHAECGVGSGGGIGGGCAHCGIEGTLGPNAILKELMVNRVLQFSRPTSYSCTVTDSSVVTAASAPQYRAVQLKSHPFTLELSDDSSWSAAELKSVLDGIASEKCRPVKEERVGCLELADRLRYLDTPDSLAAITQFLSNEDKFSQWQHALWLGLFQSQHQDDVIRLLEMRFTDPDFAVTVENMEELTGIRLRKAFPQAFAESAKPEDFRTPAVFLLQETLRKLGDSLPGKSPSTKSVSARTYEALASQDFCEKEAIIPEAERKRVLKQASVAAGVTAK